MKQSQSQSEEEMITTLGELIEELRERGWTVGITNNALIVKKPDEGWHRFNMPFIRKKRPH